MNWNEVWEKQKKNFKEDKGYCLVLIFCGLIVLVSFLECVR